MFDSIEEQMKHTAMEGSSKEKWTKYLIITAISAAVVVGLGAAAQLIK